jgi:hypothetical protein
MSSVRESWQEQRARLQAEAAALLAADPVAAAAIASLAAALEELLPAAPQDDEFLEWLGGEAGESLRGAGCAGWADTLAERLTRGEPLTDPRLIAVDLLMGRSAGEFCGRNPDDARLRLSRHVLEALPGGYGEFVPAAAVALRRVPGAEKVLATALRRRASNFIEAPDDVVDLIGRSDPAEIIAQYRAHRRLIDAWESTPSGRPLFMRDTSAWELLRLTNPAAWLEVLEILPHPALARQLVETAGKGASLQELCSLLRQARPGFDADGQWIADSKAPFLLLATLSGRLAAAGAPCEDAVGNAARGGESDLDVMMGNVLEALAARADAESLGYAWMQYLIWSGHARERWRPGEGPAGVPPLALLTVLGRLGARLPLHQSPSQWVAGEDEIWRNDRIYALMAVAGSKNPVDGAWIGKTLTAVLTGDLVSSFGVGRLAGDSSLHERAIMGIAVSAVPDPTEWFAGLWAALFRQRDRARRHRLTGGHVTPNVGQAAVIWGLCGLERLDLASEAARRLWIRLEAAARESILTDAVRLPGDAWSSALHWLAAFWPRVFPEDPLAGSPGSLDDFVSFSAGPDHEFALFALELRRQGVTVAQLKRSIPDGRLLRRGADGLGRMRGIDRQSALVAEIRELADEIEAVQAA